MDGEAQGLQEILEILRGSFGMKPHHYHKAETLFRLASGVKEGGSIADLGTFRGFSALTMALSAPGATIYTVDDYASRRGWAGEQYGPANRGIFLANMRRAGVTNITWIEMDLRAATSLWAGPSFDLVFWDLGLVARFCADFELWRTLLRPGGVFAAHDTLDGRLVTRPVLERAVASARFCNLEEWPGGIWTVRKAGK